MAGRRRPLPLELFFIRWPSTAGAASRFATAPREWGWCNNCVDREIPMCSGVDRRVSRRVRCLALGLATHRPADKPVFRGVYTTAAPPERPLGAAQGRRDPVDPVAPGITKSPCVEASIGPGLCTLPKTDHAPRSRVFPLHRPGDESSSEVAALLQHRWSGLPALRRAEGTQRTL